MFDSNLLSAQLLKAIKSNTQLRFHQANNCVLISVHGPFQVNSIKANQQAIVEVQLKMNVDLQHQRSIEQQLKELFDEVINIKEYPQQLIRIMCVVQQSKGSVYSALVNGVQLALIHQGVSLNKTILAIEYAIGNEIATFPEKEQGCIVVNALTNELVSVNIQTPQKQVDIDRAIQIVRDSTSSFQSWLRSYLYEHYDKYNII